MSDLPAASANTGLNAILTGTQYVSLHTADPGTTGANEVTGGSYARQSTTWAAASAGSKASNAAQTFSSMPAVAGGCPYAGIWSAVSGGTFIWGGPTSGLSAAIASGATVQINSGGISATLS